MSQERRPGELNALELARWWWRQLTSMRTALILLFLLAVAAIPGSVVPQRNVDALATTRWQAEHPRLTPIYEWLGLFSVYNSVWFSAIYLLLVISLVGCIVPRTWKYARAFGAPPPPAPRLLTRMPGHTSYTCAQEPREVQAQAAAVLRKRRYRVRPSPAEAEAVEVAAERGHMREVGNLIFHLAILVVLAGFAAGNLFGYRAGVIVLVGGGFANNLTQYDDFAPGSLFDTDWMEPFSFTVDDFQAEWIRSGPAAGQARGFVADLEYRTDPDAEPIRYDLKVNHPLAIGGTEIFLIGHGYAPVITVTDGDGQVAYSGPTVFLPTDQHFRSIGVVKAPDASPAQIGLEGEFYPTYAFTMETGPFSAFGEMLNPVISMLVWTGDLGMDTGLAQSVYVLDKAGVDQVTAEDGSMFRVDLAMGDSIDLPNGLGTVSFDGVERWNRIQISRSPGKFVALGGVSLALLGLMMSLFIRPRRVWVRVRRENDSTVVEVAGLDRSSGGDVTEELDALVALLRPEEKETT
ncbi:cytochrome c biogenesis protein ResB [Nocardioides limicola]|uniref:cytochrome c biogenesis protein ResB n=1 Tax=Nocardioides limicola TaxID=2803368 RepID=UPI0027DC9146|nr:cytochrome c biogenesis protein ResB [Nocardioides sp. DJM-14]